MVQTDYDDLRPDRVREVEVLVGGDGSQATSRPSTSKRACGGPGRFGTSFLS